ncbi:uncharacterized mitochondrial protein AtMg00310-like [Primulina eburnea]|uniref:uncharacterized mitochondrial protein AtMg00310-like n=1 Tax=Primulina eburnea TaxID=1245227 RepID=UPI003C6C0C62
MAQAIPAYCMGTFLLHVSLADELQRMLNSSWWGSKKNGGRSVNWLGWNKVCAAKEVGGLGFRDLHNFNLAMLGKKRWKFLSNPDALICKVFKAKHYPNGDFLNAKLGNNPSFVWKSIWSSRVLLEKGIRWKIGDGRKIRVWNEPWLREASNMRIESPPLPDMSDFLVHDLMVPGHKEWDVELLHELFNERDITQITNIPLVGSNHEDVRIWHSSENQVYTVKSGYKMAMDISLNAEIQEQEGWKKLWALKL